MANKGRFVLEVFVEDSGYFTDSIGFWNGKIHQVDQTSFVGTKEEKTDATVKVYTSRTRAQTAANKLVAELYQVDHIDIIDLDE